MPPKQGKADMRKRKIYYFDTQKDAVAYFRHQIATNDNWMRAALKALLSYQTAEELKGKETILHNDVGLQPKHAKMCTEAASRPVMYVGTRIRLHRILPHYALQLVRHCRAIGTVVIKRKTDPRRKRK